MPKRCTSVHAVTAVQADQNQIPKASGMVLDAERIARLDSIGMNWK